MFAKLIEIALKSALENPEIMKIKDFQDTSKTKFSGVQEIQRISQHAKNLRFLCIKERLRIKNEEVKINLMKQENKESKIIDIDKDSYKVME